jgi:hypothetical protein
MLQSKVVGKTETHFMDKVHWMRTPVSIFQNNERLGIPVLCSA